MITPVENHLIENKNFLVKREDLACPPPGPCFSKVRGLYQHAWKLKQSGIKTLGYLETAISMAGWGVAWVAQELDMQAVIFDPQYSDNHPARTVHELHRAKWAEFNAIVVPIKPLMTRINFNIVKKVFLSRYQNSVMLPLGLPLQETIEETSKQVLQTDLSEIQTVVTCVGSGTICVGLIKGLSSLPNTPSLIGVMCRDGNKLQKERRIRQKAGIEKGGLNDINFELVNPGWKYIDRIDIDSPFPCNPYYDTKALRFLLDNYNKLKKPILFWNIGGQANE